MMRRLIKSRKLPQKTGREDVPQSTKRSNEAERRRGREERRKEDGRPKAANQDGEISPQNPEMRIRKHCLCFDNWIVMRFNRFKDISREISDLDTLREDCGIIRKQASNDGGVLWKVVCLNVVQVRRKDRSPEGPQRGKIPC
ncbi:hypothetical protein TNCV_576261 [Trichonephila clavipes]|nr:hypothetical protein TNCV_576261 [Trichonephila clavipes]